MKDHSGELAVLWTTLFKMKNGPIVLVENYNLCAEFFYEYLVFYIDNSLRIML